MLNLYLHPTEGSVQYDSMNTTPINSAPLAANKCDSEFTPCVLTLL